VALVEVRLLTEDINRDHDNIEAVCFREFDDEIHRDSIPALIRDLGQMKLTVRKLLEHFCLVAHIAGADVLADVPG
jgi:hypothetical protein